MLIPIIKRYSFFVIPYIFWDFGINTFDAVFLLRDTHFCNYCLPFTWYKTTVLRRAKVAVGQDKRINYHLKLWMPIDRVPTRKSFVFCLGIIFLFFPIWPFLGPSLLQGLFSWKGVMHVTLYEVPEESQFSDSVWWLYEPAM